MVKGRQRRRRQRPVWAGPTAARAEVPQGEQDPWTLPLLKGEPGELARIILNASASSLRSDDWADAAL